MFGHVTDSVLTMLQNHSCLPNTARAAQPTHHFPEKQQPKRVLLKHSSGGTQEEVAARSVERLRLRITALVDIDAGTEVTRCYVNPRWPLFASTEAAAAWKLEVSKYAHRKM